MLSRVHISAIVLLSCLVLPFCGSYLWLQGKVKEARDNAIAHLQDGLPEEETIILTFSISDTETVLEWEHSREFRYNGNMYDVVHTAYHGDSISYQCYLDYKESKLKRAISQLAPKWAQGEPQRDNQQQRIADFFKLVYCIDRDQQTGFDTSVSDTSFFGYASFWYDDLAYDPIVPPPKLS